MNLDTEYNTFVFKGDLKPTTGNNPLVEPFCGVESTAWSRGHALREKEELEDFVRNCSDGSISKMNIPYMAKQLMDKLNFS